MQKSIIIIMFKKSICAAKMEKSPIVAMKDYT